MYLCVCFIVKLIRRTFIVTTTKKTKNENRSREMSFDFLVSLSHNSARENSWFCVSWKLCPTLSYTYNDLPCNVWKNALYGQRWSLEITYLVKIYEKLNSKDYFWSCMYCGIEKFSRILWNNTFNRIINPLKRASFLEMLTWILEILWISTDLRLTDFSYVW